MKRVLTIAALFFVTAGMAQKAKTITISGKVTGDTKGYDYIMYYTNVSPMDSVLIKNGKFKIKLPYTETYTQVLVPQFDMRGKRGYRPFPILIDGTGDIKIEMDAEKGFFESNMSGSKTAVYYHDFLKQQNQMYKKIADGIVALHGKSFAPSNTPLAEKINATRDSLTKLYMGSLVIKFVEEHKNEYVGVCVLNASGKSVFDVETLEKMFRLLSDKQQQTNEGKGLAAYIRGVRNTTIGATVKNFVLNNPEGNPVSFEQFKGKYVWIDFWASWCGPCKMAFPHMKELYAKYKDKGFEILGISTDSKIEPWLKILPTLQNPWPQVWDNSNIKSEFAVTAYPTSFLIGPDGKIILKEVGYEPNGASAMDKKLEEIFGAAKASKKEPVNAEKVVKK